MDLPSDIYDRRLALRRTAGNEQLADQLLAMLLDELQTLQPALQSAVGRQDWEALAESCHRLAGAADYCGMPQLQQLALSLEGAARGLRVAAARRFHDELQALIRPLLSD